MSFVDTYFRHQCFITRLNRGYASLIELQQDYERQCSLTDRVYIFSERTFCRDREMMLIAYKVDIRWCKINRKYFIDK